MPLSFRGSVGAERWRCPAGGSACAAVCDPLESEKSTVERRPPSASKKLEIGRKFQKATPLFLKIVRFAFREKACVFSGYNVASSSLTRPPCV